jgi:homopolymeric O-antigen transport system ATP-binding protein
MGDIAIGVESISKAYRIEAATVRHDTLRDQAMYSLKTLLHPRTRRATKEMFWALREVSFDVKRGEILGLIGRNGAGKSTLLKILSRITEPTSGRARIHGRVGSLLEVGTGFDHELTGRENVYLSAVILGMGKAEIDARFDEIVAFSGTERFIDTPVKRYSSGMYVRLAFSVAAHLQPEILLIDEVLAVGDAAFQKKCLGKIDEVRRDGRTVVFVSHNMAMVENLCTKAVLIQEGRVTEQGQTRTVINKYIESMGSQHIGSLSARTDRTGAGEVTAQQIDVLNADGSECPNAMSAQTVIVRLHYQCNVPGVFANSRISISVRKDEHVYFLMSTELVDKRQLDLEGRGAVDFVIAELPLSAGEYSLQSFIECRGVIQDWVVGAASLTVIDGDFYGTGRNYPDGWQGKTVLVRHHWRHVKAPVGATLCDHR